MRRYLTAAATAGVGVTATISDEDVRQVLLALPPTGGRPRGEGWALCGEHRAAIERWLGEGLRLTKIRKLLVRQGVQVAYLLRDVATRAQTTCSSLTTKRV